MENQHCSLKSPVDKERFDMLEIEIKQDVDYTEFVCDENNNIASGKFLETSSSIPDYDVLKEIKTEEVTDYFDIPPEDNEIRAYVEKVPTNQRPSDQFNIKPRMLGESSDKFNIKPRKLGESKLCRASGRRNFSTKLGTISKTLPPLFYSDKVSKNKLYAEILKSNPIVVLQDIMKSKVDFVKIHNVHSSENKQIQDDSYQVRGKGLTSNSNIQRRKKIKRSASCKNYFTERKLTLNTRKTV